MGGLLVACGPRERTAALLSASTAGPAALNAPLALHLDGPVEPLGVTSQSVDVRRDDGRRVPARIETVAGDVVVTLVVTPALLADSPAEVVVRVQGLPSPHALATTDGRRLHATTVVRWSLTGHLEGRARAAPRLASLNGLSLPLPDLLRTNLPLRLVFDGALDPATVRSENCPLDPLEHGLALKPLLPGVDWTCVGQRFELTLDPGRLPGAIQLNLARFGLRDFSGRSPEPLLKTEIRAS